MHIDADIPGTPLDLYKWRTSSYVSASMSCIYTKITAAIMRPKLRSSSNFSCTPSLDQKTSDFDTLHDFFHFPARPPRILVFNGPLCLEVLVNRSYSLPTNRLPLI